MGRLFDRRNESVRQMTSMDSITLGTVIDTNDPQQMNRVKVCCPSLGDSTNTDGSELPWATCVSPLAGMTNPSFKKGPNAGNSNGGPTAYGIWGTPKRGSTVLVACIDGDPYYRVYMGAIFDQGVVNALPHGRYFYQGGSGEPEGPLDSSEMPIEPLYSNQVKAFEKKSGNYEWRTRGADYSAAGNVSEFAHLAASNKADETTSTPFQSKDGKSFDIKNGYAKNRLAGYDGDDESSVYSWTSPGFHSISMDDRSENCRIRIRTVSGAQILMDDTNERIYISTAQGNNWIEMDQNGNIDIHGKNISLHAQKDLNLTAEETVRIHGKNGVHAFSGAEVNIQAQTDVSVKAEANVRVQGGANTNLEAGGTMNLLAEGNIIETGAKIHLNGPSAAPAAAKPAKWTSRVPQHEPWSRTMTKEDFTHEPEFEYDDPKVGIIERGEETQRGERWRR